MGGALRGQEGACVLELQKPTDKLFHRLRRWRGFWRRVKWSHFRRVRGALQVWPVVGKERPNAIVDNVRGPRRTVTYSWPVAILLLQVIRSARGIDWPLRVSLLICRLSLLSRPEFPGGHHPKANPVSNYKVECSCPYQQLTKFD